MGFVAEDANRCYGTAPFLSCHIYMYNSLSCLECMLLPTWSDLTLWHCLALGLPDTMDTAVGAGWCQLLVRELAILRCKHCHNQEASLLFV
jgi:hypothetical protein